MRIADRLAISARSSSQDVLDAATAEVLAKAECAAAVVAFEPVDLPTHRFESSVQGVVAAGPLQAAGIAKRILSAIEGYARIRSERFQCAAE